MLRQLHARLYVVHQTISAASSTSRFTPHSIQRVTTCLLHPHYQHLSHSLHTRSGLFAKKRSGPPTRTPRGETDGNEALPDFAGEDDVGRDHDDSAELEQDSKEEAKDLRAVNKQLGLTGGMSKAERLALRMRRSRAQKANSEEQKHGKARAEKMKEKARKAAMQKMQAAVGEGEVDEIVVEADESKKGDDKPLDKHAAKAVQAALSQALPKVAEGVRRSPAEIAAAAKEAARIKAEILKEQSIVRINHVITASQIILIGADGKKIGMFSRSEALRRAKQENLDLFQVSPHIPGKEMPATCKLVNYKTYRAAEERREKELLRAKRLLNREMKTVQVKAKIAPGDLATKINRAKHFLNRNHPVRVTYYGKQPHDPLIFIPLFEQCVERLLLDGAIEPGSLSASKPYLNFSPINDKKREQMLPRLTDAQKKAHNVYMDANGTWKQRGRVSEEDLDDDEDEDEDEDEDDEVDEDEEEEEEDEDKPSEASKSSTSTATTPSTTTNASSTQLPTKAASTQTPSSAPAKSPQSSSATSAAATPAPTPKKEKHQKSKPSYTIAPALFSRAALQNIKKEAELKGQKI